MSFGPIEQYNALAAMQSGKGGGNPVRNVQLQAAFDTQMRTAQSLFGEGSTEYGEGSASRGFDMGILNDAMMFEALSTISRLMRDEAGLPRQVAVSRKMAGTTQAPVAAPLPEAPNVGSLSARFESGSDGVATIGYDRVGGTSYGKYQIASKPGSMDRFLTYLDAEAPELATRLRQAGPTDTGSKEGGMPEAWKEIAAQQPERFEKLQHDFIATETYDPARNMIFKQTGLDFDNAPPALREVLWSTAVQHGPTGAARIFNKVIDRFVGQVSEGKFDAKLIEGVYDTRKTQFGSSTQRVRRAVANRLNEEKQIALNMLGETSLNRIV
ncbi:hypothetical protein GM415_12645 [Pseudodesulfovibrio cashew]|uniref:Type VI secretion system spike protein VgrG3-like C-terminal domain-containing protein n=1 Tax=Pseudodesulfovibrio cashew TaxID=2678688 RepID=A0A6I6JKX7_9BACT|nr:hypothetical protein [Pseudodesulfovibrio cashew]QGY40943.1 hypothetical protein GM415_12645 [Pseudodesulfovibrio cashew]